MRPCQADILLGFDYGLKRIGVAVGNRITGQASPLETVPARDGKPDWEAITRLIDQWQPAQLVVGRPLHMDGSEQELTQRARRFGNQLGGRYNLPVHAVDERLSSVEAEQRLRDEGIATGRDKGAVDRTAAAIILQGWLDSHPQP